MCDTLPAARVRGFQPSSPEDFDDNQVYAVYRSTGEEEEAGAQPAHILALAGEEHRGRGGSVHSVMVLWVNPVSLCPMMSYSINLHLL